MLAFNATSLRSAYEVQAIASQRQSGCRVNMLWLICQDNGSGVSQGSDRRRKQRENTSCDNETPSVLTVRIDKRYIRPRSDSGFAALCTHLRS